MDSHKRGFPEIKNKKLKDQAVAFYSRHNVTEALEKLLNELFLAAPKDVYGYMSEYFSSLSLEPVISGFTAREGLDSFGGKSVHVDLHCTINGVDKVVYSGCVPVDMWLRESDCVSSSTDESKDKRSHKESKTNLEQNPPNNTGDTLDSSESYIDVLKSIKKHIVSSLCGLSPKSQKEVDEALMTVLTPEGSKLHPSSMLVCSCSCATATAHLFNTPLYLHLSSLADGQTNSKFTVPFPVVSALAGGKAGIGKLKFLEYCITTLPGSPFPEQIKMLSTVHLELKKGVIAKYGLSSQGTLPNGAFCPSIDKPEQGLDLIREAAKNAKLELDENIGVFIVVGAERLYDQSKQKYELIAGQWKSSDEVINMYSDLLQSYPGLVGYIDPLHHQDLAGWRKLQEKLGGKCFLVADDALSMGLAVKSLESHSKSLLGSSSHESGNGDDASTKLDDTSLSSLSCAALPFEPTLTKMMHKASMFKGYTHNGYVMMRVPQNMSMNTIAADLAVALHCRFIRLGAVSGQTSSALLSRLLHIREELITKKLHEPAKANLFSFTSEGQP